MSALWCELAWLGGEAPATGVSIEIEGERIASVTNGVEAPHSAQRLRGLTLPGLVNAHSHSFQRALRGRTHGGEGSFWTWRDQMYALAESIDPDGVFELARATFGEMLLAGITAVGEFHYLHHRADGRPYQDPNALGEAITAAAEEAGIRLTLIDACYLDGGLERFRDRDAAAWIERVEALPERPGRRVAGCVHSVRAVDAEAIAVIADWARGRPLHAHVSEQPAENERCLERNGVTPTRLLADAGALSQRFTAVHATHLSAEDLALLGEAGATACLCPTTERDLADGIGRARELADAGCRLALGSDSQAVIDLLEEARAVELDERLATGTRGRNGALALLEAATAGGAQSIGWPEVGAIEAGRLADLTTLSLDGVRLAGTPAQDAVAAAVFAGAAGDVTDVHVGGRRVVAGGAHHALDVQRLLAEAVGVR